MTSRRIEWKRFIWRDTTPLDPYLEWWEKIFFYWDETFVKRITIQRVANRALSKI